MNAINEQYMDIMGIPIYGHANKRTNRKMNICLNILLMSSYIKQEPIQIDDIPNAGDQHQCVLRVFNLSVRLMARLPPPPPLLPRLQLFWKLVIYCPNYEPELPNCISIR